MGLLRRGKDFFNSLMCIFLKKGAMVPLSLPKLPKLRHCLMPIHPLTCIMLKEEDRIDINPTCKACVVVLCKWVFYMYIMLCQYYCAKTLLRVMKAYSCALSALCSFFFLLFSYKYTRRFFI